MKKILIGLMMFVASICAAQTFPVNNLQINGQVGGNACYTVQNVAALRSTIRAMAGGSVANVCTSGYYSPADGGGNQYYVFSTTSSGFTDDGCFTFIGSDGTVWRPKNSGSVNVNQCGAKGDGTTDDSARIQVAINTFNYVQFLAKTYVINTQLTGKNNLSLICVTSRVCTLKAGAAINSLIYFQDISDVLISGMILNGNNNTISNLRFYSQNTPSNVKIEDNEITGTKSDVTLQYGGIEFSEYPGANTARYKNVTITNNYIHDVGTHGAIAAYVDKVSFSNNTLLNIGQHGFEAVTSSQINQTGNVIDNCGTVGPGGSALGVGSQSYNFVISNNTINNCKGDAPITVEYTSNYGIVSGNAIYNSWANAGINVSYGSSMGNVFPFDAIRNISILNNTIYNKQGVSTSTTATGINVYSGSIQGLGIKVAGNIVDGFNVGIAMQYLQSSNVDDNTILNLTGTNSVAVNAVWMTKGSVRGNKTNSTTGDHSFQILSYAGNSSDQLNISENSVLSSGSSANKALVYIDGTGTHIVNGNKTGGSSNYVLAAAASRVSMTNNIGNLSGAAYSATSGGILFAASGNDLPTSDFSNVGSSKIFSGTAIPTSGTYNKGDQVINSNPSVGAPKGWTCTVGGTPGTWVSQGNL